MKSSSLFFLFYLCFISCLTIVTTAQGATTEWNACGTDLGLDFTYASGGYKMYKDSDYPDYDFFLSLCEPIRVCHNYETDDWSCGQSAELIPGCGTAMLCALNRSSRQGITLIDLSEYNFTPRSFGRLTAGAMMRFPDVPPAAKPIFCNDSLSAYKIDIELFSTTTTELSDALFYVCRGGAIISLFTPNIRAYTPPPLPLPPTTDSSSSNPTAVAFAILFGVLFFVLAIAFIIVYRRFQKELKAFSSTASSDQYHLQDPGNVDSDAELQNAKQNQKNGEQNSSAMNGLEIASSAQSV